MIVCVGSVNVDILANVDKFPHEDGEETIHSLETCPGGAAANIASGLGRLKKDVAFFGCVGTDHHTSMLLDSLKEDTVNTSYIQQHEEANNTVFVFIESEGKRKIYAYNYGSLPDYPESLWEKTSHLIFTSRIEKNIIETYATLAEEAQRRNIPVFVDPGHIFAKEGVEGMLPLLKHTDFLFPSGPEYEMLGREEVLNLVPHVIVTEGKAGATLYKEGRKAATITAPAVETVDSTGAGDCLVAAFVAAYTEGKSLDEALSFAVYKATHSTTKKGARSMI